MLLAASANVAPPARDWEALEARINRLNRSDPRAAADVAAEWLAEERELGSPEGYTRALRAQAHALRFLGSYEKAVWQYEDAEERFQGLNLTSEAARTSIGRVTTLRYLGRYEEALDLAQRTRGYFLNHGQWMDAAKQGNNLGTLYRRMGRLSEAVRVYREARKVFRELGDRSSLADVEQNLGNVLVDLGRYDQALRRLRAAERIRRSLGLESEVALILLNIGTLSHQRGDYGEALRALGQARQIYESLGVDRGARLVDLQMLPTFVALNLHQESQSTAERAIEGLRALEMPFELAQALLSAGRVAELAGDRAQARAHNAEARELFARSGNRLWEARSRLQEARRIAADADASEYSRALRDCQIARRQLEAAGALEQAAFGRLVEGTLRSRLGQVSSAIKCFQRVLKRAEELHADHLLLQVHAAIGELLEPTDLEQAIASYRRAITHLEALRARARADDLKLAFLADKAKFYERIVSLLVRNPSPGAVSEAFRVLERSKSRTLLEDLLEAGREQLGARRPRTQRLARRVTDIRTRLNDLYTRAYGGDEPPSSQQVHQSDQARQIADLEAAYASGTRELQLTARQEDPSLVDLDGDPATDLELPASTAVIEYYALDGDLVAFVKTARGVSFRRLGPIDLVSDLAEQLNFQIGSGAFGTGFLCANIDRFRQSIDHCLHELWIRLIGPVAGDIVGCHKLVIVPHGLLHSLPFHAFHDGRQYLTERHTISYAPSAGVYQMCLRSARPLGHRAVILGLEDPGLPKVRDEVAAVAGSWPSATILTGRRASRRGLRRLSGGYDVLHIATHAVFRADNPMFSSIKLADTWLTATELSEMVRGAQLVTLSACETGVAGLAGADEILGFTRGILGAGCSTVIASFWPVPDETTALLMDHFYGSLQQGSDPASTLRSAMLSLRAAYDHPYFWAPFAVIGAGVAETVQAAPSLA